MNAKRFNFPSTHVRLTRGFSDVAKPAAPAVNRPHAAVASEPRVPFLPLQPDVLSPLSGPSRSHRAQSSRECVRVPRVCPSFPFPLLFTLHGFCVHGTRTVCTYPATDKTFFPRLGGVGAFHDKMVHFRTCGQGLILLRPYRALRTPVKAPAAVALASRRWR